jgi:hypothetical protein
MRFTIRTMVLGSLLACGATAVQAQSRTPEAAPPPAPTPAPRATPIDLSLHPVAATPSVTSAPLDLSLKPAVAPISTPFAPSLQPVVAQPPSPAVPPLQAAATPPSPPVDLMQSASAEVKQVARWVVDTGDNARLPFLLIDKVNAQVFAFNPAGQLQASAPVLLGMSRGDHLLAPNDAPMSAMPPQARVTPAGRFVSRLAIDSHGKELLVLDYAASISLHPVVKGTPAERRAERLSSPTSQDNRISFGCINAPPAFYQTYVSQPFANTKGIVYVLPETRPASEMFGFQPAGGALPVGAAAAVSGAQPGPGALSTPSTPAVAAPDAR